MKENIKPFNYKISIDQRRIQNKHNSFLVWFTGLSGSGKSTLANLIEQHLFDQGISTYVLDGDNIRNGINKGLSFSPEDRTENIRRVSEVANLMVDSGIVVLAAFISPYKKDRENIRNIIKDVNFVEVFINSSIEECERRDVKGLYKKARSGEIKNMTGITAPYEIPENPDIEINTEALTIEESVNRILNGIQDKLKLSDE